MGCLRQPLHETSSGIGREPASRKKCCAIPVTVNLRKPSRCAPPPAKVGPPMNRIATELVRDQVAAAVEEAVARTPISDIHTHLYDPAFGKLLLWGIDDLLTYHYLVAESFRYFEMPFEEFWELPKARQAELIWDALFIKNSPVSESCRGILT